MIVPFIFENEVYIKEKQPYLWVFYKFASLCIKNDLPIIAESAYFNKPSEFKKNKHFGSTVMEKYNITDDNIEHIKRFEITEKMKNKVVKKYENGEKCWISLIKQRDKDLEEIVENAINELEKKYEKIKAFIVWTWLPSIEHVAKKHNIRIFNMEMSSIREPFYNELLTYCQLQNKYDSSGIETKYKELISNKENFYFSRKEIFSLFGSKNSLRYLSSFSKQEEYEIGYALGLKTDCFSSVYSSIPQANILQILKKMKKSVCIRPHPAEPIDVKQLGFTEDHSNSAFEWMLKCKSIICDISNVGLEAILLGKNLISVSDKLPTSFNKKSDINKLTGEIIDTKKLNFLIFYWFVPEKLTQDYDYLKWRLSNPKVKEIYDKHISYILEERNIKISDLKNKNENERIEIILKSQLNKYEYAAINKMILMDNINSYDSTVYNYKKSISVLNRKIIELEEENAKLALEKEFYNNELKRVLNSTSWKVTKPLRKIKSLKAKKTKVEKEENNNLPEITQNANSIHKSEYQNDIDFTDYRTDIKALAFYSVSNSNNNKNNDKYSKREPNDNFRFNKLNEEDILKKQIHLATKHGIYGFIFDYSVNSKKIIDSFLKSNITFKFCLHYKLEDTNKDLMKNIKHILTDKRYIKIDNKPIVLISKLNESKDKNLIIEDLRQTALETGIGNIFILSESDIYNTDYDELDYVDGQFDFPPFTINNQKYKITTSKIENAYDYEKIVNEEEINYRNHFPLKAFYYTATMEWNTSQNKDINIYYHFSIENYYKWLRIIIEETRRRNSTNKRYLFINSWNDWKNGLALEPDNEYGYSNINTLSKAIFDIPLNKNIDTKKSK